jgi:hypothetical protein
MLSSDGFPMMTATLNPHVDTDCPDILCPSLSLDMSLSVRSRQMSCAWAGNAPEGSKDSREVVLAKRRARRLAERLAKPAYVNSDACCRDGMAGLAYESALLGNRTALVPCSDITLAEHLALLMAMRDAPSRLPGRVAFRVDSTAVVGPLRRDYPDLAEAKRQIADLLRRHPTWSLLLVEREKNWVAHNLANKPLREL